MDLKESNMNADINAGSIVASYVYEAVNPGDVQMSILSVQLTSILNSKDIMVRFLFEHSIYIFS